LKHFPSRPLGRPKDTGCGSLHLKAGAAPRPAKTVFRTGRLRHRPQRGLFDPDLDLDLDTDPDSDLPRHRYRFLTPERRSARIAGSGQQF
jgi:hypothetical protein